MIGIRFSGPNLTFRFAWAFSGGLACASLKNARATNIRLSAADRGELEMVAANRNSPQKHVWRAKIVLLTADDHGTAEIMRATGKAKTVIWRWQERFGEEGVAGLWRDKTRPSRVAPLGPEEAERVVALTLAGPPPTASHWAGAACSGWRLRGSSRDLRLASQSFPAQS